MEYRLTTPCTAQDLAPLKAGDTVLLSGVVYTARDQAHKRMIEALDKGEALPFDLTGSAIYYVGPTPERPGAATCTSPARRRIWKAKTNGVLSPLHKTKPAWNWQTRCFVQKKVGLFVQTSCKLLASTAKV